MKSINREIARLAAPAIASNITVPLLGLSDTAISGHLGADVYIAAIAVGTMMMNTVFWLFGFLRMGTTGLTAQACGAGDKDQCVNLLRQSVTLGAAIGVAMAVAAGPLLSLLLALIDPDPEVGACASTYFRICIWYAPASLATMAILGWFLGMQDTVRPMTISIGVNVINIAVSLTLVLGMHMGFKGVAMGTLIANWSGLLLALVLVRRFARSHGLRLSIKAKGTGRGNLARFFSVNTDILLRSACIMAVSLGMTSVGARIGVTTLAVNTILMQFFIFFSYFMDGLAFTGEALAGRSCGARDHSMLMSVIRHILAWSALVAGVFFIIYVFGARTIIGLLTDQTDVIGYAMHMRLFVVLLPPVTVAAFVFDGFFIGLTATRQMLAATAVSAAAFFAMAFIHPWSADTVGLPTNNMLWTAFLIYLFLRGAILGALTPRMARQATCT